MCSKVCRHEAKFRLTSTSFIECAQQTNRQTDTFLSLPQKHRVKPKNYCHEDIERRIRSRLVPSSCLPKQDKLATTSPQSMTTTRTWSCRRRCACRRGCRQSA
eukprot:6112733-Pleurochrysis_carterae.AAC.1